MYLDLHCALLSRKINVSAAESHMHSALGKKIWKEVTQMVELDQFKYTLETLQKPLVEVRDSL